MHVYAYIQYVAYTAYTFIGVVVVVVGYFAVCKYHFVINRKIAGGLGVLCYTGCLHEAFNYISLIWIVVTVMCVCICLYVSMYIHLYFIYVISDVVKSR